MSSKKARTSRTSFRSRSPIQNDSHEVSNANNSSVDEEASNSIGNSSSKSPQSETCVNVSNIPIKCNPEELKNLFEEKVGNVISVEFLKDKGKFKGHGIVEFEDKEAAEKAVDIMYKHKLKGRRLVVKFKCDESSSCPPTCSVGHSPDKPSNNNETRPNPEFDTYGLNSELLKTLRISGPLTKKVLIFNIDKEVNEEKLEEIFNMAGRIVKVTLHSADGNSKGSVEYEHPLEAVQAISMLNGQKLYNEVISVLMGQEEINNSMNLPSLGLDGKPLKFDKNETPSKGGNETKFDDKAASVDKKECSPKGNTFDKNKNGSPKGNTFDKNKDASSPETCVLRCSICLLNCVQPVLLPCYHIFCFLCVKGVTRSSQLCPLCRQEIPPNFLNNPQLVPTEQPTVAFDGSYQWFYEGRNGWWQYDDRTSCDIETAYQQQKNECEVLIAGILYIIDFQGNLQRRKTDYSRIRRIKRDLITISKKGVAGIRLNPDVEVVTPVQSRSRAQPQLVDLDDDCGDKDCDDDDDGCDVDDDDCDDS